MSALATTTPVSMHTRIRIVLDEASGLTMSDFAAQTNRVSHVVSLAALLTSPLTSYDLAHDHPGWPILRGGHAVDARVALLFPQFRTTLVSLHYGSPADFVTSIPEGADAAAGFIEKLVTLNSTRRQRRAEADTAESFAMIRRVEAEAAFLEHQRRESLIAAAMAFDGTQPELLMQAAQEAVLAKMAAADLPELALLCLALVDACKELGVAEAPPDVLVRLLTSSDARGLAGTLSQIASVTLED